MCAGRRDRRSRRLRELAVAGLCLAGACALAAGSSAAPAQGTAAGVPSLGNVFLIIGENTSERQVTGQRAPYLTGTLRPQAAWLTNYHSLPGTSSLGDYVGMTSGQFTHCEANNALPTHCHQSVQNVFSQLESHGMQWRTWAESMDNPCDIVDHGAAWSGNIYSAHHNPAIYYTRIEGGRYDEALKPSADCRHNDLPMGTTAPNDTSFLDSALASGDVGNLNVVVPNDCENGHDPCAGNRIRQFDSFLAREVPKIQASPAFGSNGLILVTWDEGADPPRDPTHVLLAAIGPQVQPGTYSGARLTHYGLLHTLENGFGLRPLRAAAQARPITRIWQ